MELFFFYLAEVEVCSLRESQTDHLLFQCIIQRKLSSSVIEEMDAKKGPAPQNRSGIFENCYVHILPLGLGKKRMSLFQTQIVNQGGICVSKLTAGTGNLTHIVLEDSTVKDSERCVKLLRGMHVDINAAVKVVGTRWLSSCLKERMYVDTKEFELSPVLTRTNEVITQCKVQPLHNVDCTVGGEDPDTVKDDLPTFTVQHSPPKKFKPEVTEVC
jgi:hypothetical protein